MTRTLQPEDLYEFARVGDPALHPDGTVVAYTVATADAESDGTLTSVWVAPLVGGEPRRYTSGRHDGSPQWSPDGHWLAFIRQPEAGAPQLWVLPTAGGDAQLLDEGPVVAYDWAPDSTTLAVIRLVDPGESAADGAGHEAEPIVVERLGFKADGMGLFGVRRTHLFTVTRDGGDARQLTDGDVFVSAPAWAGDGTRIAVLTAVHEDRDLDVVQHAATVAAEGGELEILTDWEGVATWAGWLPDGRLLLAGLERVDTSLHTRLFTVPAAGGKPEPLFPGFDRNVMIGGPGYPGCAPRVVGDEVLFCARDQGTVHLYAGSLTGGAPRKVVGGDDRLVSGCSTAGEQMVYVLADGGSPGELVTRTGPGDQERRLTHHNSFLDDVTVFPAESRMFAAPDGATVHGRVLTDGGPAQLRPLLLDIHGGPHNAWGPALDDVHLYHQALAAQGWVVLTLNAVGSDGYGQDWYAGLRGGWGRNDEGQLLAAVDALIAEGLVDASRIAVTGYSYGGFMTNWLLSRTDRFAAAVTGGCVTNLASFYGTCDLGQLLLSSELGADLTADPERYTDLSPLTRAGAVTTPTLILHGEEDHRCPVGQAEEWFAQLRRRRIPVRLVRYPGAGHLFILNGRPSHRLHYNQQVIDWLAEHVA